MRYRIIMTSREMFDFEADNEEEAYEMISLHEVEPVFKKYFGDDIVIEGDESKSAFVLVNGKEVKLHESIRRKHGTNK